MFVYNVQFHQCGFNIQLPIVLILFLINCTVTCIKLFGVVYRNIFNLFSLR